MLKNSRLILASLALALSSSVMADPISDAVNGEARDKSAFSRDEYRHPQQTLRFFGIQPNMTVVEVWPGGGWYTDILAPLVSEEGQFIAAHFYIDDESHDYFRKSLASFKDKVANHPPYKNIEITQFHPVKAKKIAESGSADMVLTFRNAHNWYMNYGDAGVDAAFSAFFDALKPGGVLGLVDHRLPEDASLLMQKGSGYMKTSSIIAAAEKAGFVLAGSSEVNANPQDHANHPKGVWTLPPTLALGEDTSAHYLAIGESDRMTLKFVKP